MNYQEGLEQLDFETQLWEEAKTQAPTHEDVRQAQETIQNLKQETLQAEIALRVIAVKKACVFGWDVIAQDFGVTPRLLHKWHKDYCPEVEDLVTREAKNKAKRESIVARIDKQLSRQQEEVKKLEDFKARLTETATINNNLYY